MSDDLSTLPYGHLIDRLGELQILIDESERYLDHLRTRRLLILNELQRRDLNDREDKEIVS